MHWIVTPWWACLRVQELDLSLSYTAVWDPIPTYSPSDGDDVSTLLGQLPALRVLRALRVTALRRAVELPYLGFCSCQPQLAHVALACKRLTLLPQPPGGPAAFPPAQEESSLHLGMATAQPLAGPWPLPGAATPADVPASLHFIAEEASADMVRRAPAVQQPALFIHLLRVMVPCPVLMAMTYCDPGFCAAAGGVLAEPGRCAEHHSHRRAVSVPRAAAVEAGAPTCAGSQQRACNAEHGDCVR